MASRYVRPHASADDGWWAGYRWVVLGTAALHALTGVVMWVRGRGHDWPVTVCASYASWQKTDASEPCGPDNTCVSAIAYRRVGDASPVSMVVLFCLLSAAFQATPAAFEEMWRVYRSNCEAGRQPLRWVEYSITASLMVTVVLLLNGNVDVWILAGAAGLNWITMVLGGLHEDLLWSRLALERHTRVLFGRLDCCRAHLAGWVTFGITWLIIVTQFSWSLDDAGDRVPGWVRVIIWAQLFLFLTFGINQTLATAAQLGALPGWTYIRSEVVYTILSLAAKQALAWAMYYGITGRDASVVISASPCLL